MPAALAWIIPAIVGTAGVGTSIYEGDKSASAAQAAQKAQQAQALQAEQQQQQQQTLTQNQSFRALSPDVQSQVGGSLTPESFASIVAALAGNPGQANQATSALFPGAAGSSTPGSGAPGLTSNSSQPAGLSDTLTHLFGGDTQGPFSTFAA